MKEKSVKDALGAANAALERELENRGKLKEEIKASEPELLEAIETSQKVRSLTREVQEKPVTEKVMEIAVKGADEALAETQAALEHELEKRRELERVMEETEDAIVEDIEKGKEARLRLATGEKRASDGE